MSSISAVLFLVHGMGLGKNRVNKKCQHFSVLIGSRPAGWLASWGLLTIFLLPLGIFSVCFQSGDLKLVLFGVNILKVPLISWEMCWECGSITRKVIYCSEMGTPTPSCKGTLAAAAVGAELAFKPAAEDVQMQQRRLEHGQQHLLGSSDKCWDGWVVLNHILLKLF